MVEEMEKEGSSALQCMLNELICSSSLSSLALAACAASFFFFSRLRSAASSRCFFASSLSWAKSCAVP